MLPLGWSPSGRTQSLGAVLGLLTDQKAKWTAGRYEASLSSRRAGQTDSRAGEIAESCVFFTLVWGYFKVSWGPLITEGHAKLSTLSVPSPLLTDVFGSRTACIGFNSKWADETSWRTLQ